MTVTFLRNRFGRQQRGLKFNSNRATFPSFARRLRYLILSVTNVTKSENPDFSSFWARCLWFRDTAEKRKHFWSPLSLARIADLKLEDDNGLIE